MSFRVICISRTLGAGGEAIGHAVAQRLGFRYIDEQIIERAAQLAQVDPKVVASTEHRQPLLQRLLDKLSLAHELVGPMTLATGVPLEAFIPQPAAPRAMADDLRLVIRAAIDEVATAGKAVIVAHAASLALSADHAALRVLITASVDTRAQRLAELANTTPAEAAKAVAASDRARRDYFERFYSITDEAPTRYDLVLNTDVVTVDQATAMIAAAF